MPLNLIEADLEDVQPELRQLYVKDSKSKTFRLDLPDLDSYVSARVASIERELKIVHDNEHKLVVGAALRNAGIQSNYEPLVYASLRERVRVETSENERVVRVLQPDGGMPMIGSGSDGFATLDDLAQEAVKLIPSAFKPSGGEMPRSAPMGHHKTLSRSEFYKLAPVERSKKMDEGYRLIDPEPATDSPSPRLGEKIMSRAEFDQLRPKERSERILKEGFRVLD